MYILARYYFVFVCLSSEQDGQTGTCVELDGSNETDGVLFYLFFHAG